MPNVVIDVVCNGGFVGHTTTAGAQGIWQLASVPEESCTVTPGLACRQFEHIVAGVGDGQAFITIVVNTANQPKNQSIQFLTAIDTGPCNDQDPCTETDNCGTGVCVGVPVDCSPFDTPCATAACHPETGTCKLQVNADGTPCDDGDPCTTADSCLSGTCTGPEKDCSSIDDQCRIGACDSRTGACESRPADEGMVCDDGSYCTTGAICVVGTCTGGTPRVCNDFVDCTVDSCDEQLDSCVHVADSTRCDNGLYCDGAEPCDPLTGCEPGSVPCVAPQVCDEDLDACTGCSSDQGCDDGSPCTADQCVNGVGHSAGIDGCCVSVADCDKQNPCTDVACVAGVCKGENNTAACDDGDSCTSGDTCSGGVCVGGANGTSGGLPPHKGDADADGVSDADDTCPGTSNAVSVDAEGCSCAQRDGDEDGTDDCIDECPDDPAKVEMGVCGCGVPDSDTDGDRTPDCNDACPDDAATAAPGVCGCNAPDLDRDADGLADCLDLCPGTATGVPVGPDGCALDVPAGQPVGDAEEGSENLPPDVASGFETSVQSVRSRGCGACGAFGTIFWPVLLLGFFMLRAPAGSPRPGP